MTPTNSNDVLAYWRWYYESVLWPAAPKKFLAFWRLVETSKIFQLICSHQDYDLKWRHALAYHLGEMWFAADHRGKLRKSWDVEQGLCVLHLIIAYLLGPTDKKGDHSKRWKVSSAVLKDFFPSESPSSVKRENLRTRVNAYLHENRQPIPVVNDLTRKRTIALFGGAMIFSLEMPPSSRSAMDSFLDVLSSSTYLTSEEYLATMRQTR
jgi:hypothetical protein